MPGHVRQVPRYSIAAARLDNRLLTNGASLDMRRTQGGTAMRCNYMALSAALWNSPTTGETMTSKQAAQAPQDLLGIGQPKAFHPYVTDDGWTVVTPGAESGRRQLQGEKGCGAIKSRDPSQVTRRT